MLVSDGTTVIDKTVASNLAGHTFKGTASALVMQSCTPRREESRQLPMRYHEIENDAQAPDRGQGEDEGHQEGEALQAFQEEDQRPPRHHLGQRREGKEA